MTLPDLTQALGASTPWAGFGIALIYLIDRQLQRRAQMAMTSACEQCRAKIEALAPPKPTALLVLCLLAFVMHIALLPSNQQRIAGVVRAVEMAAKKQPPVKREGCPDCPSSCKCTAGKCECPADERKGPSSWASFDGWMPQPVRVFEDRPNS